MEARHVEKLRALPTMTDAEAQAAFELTQAQAMLDCWPKLLDELCRLQAELDNAAHVNLESVLEENETLKDEVQQLTDRLGELTIGQPKR